ncbi:hypothetical protein SprV_0602126500 [Sparganum proliferum]
MVARGTENVAVGEAFSVTRAVKQGCILAPARFSLMFSALLMDAYRDEHPEIRSPAGRTANSSTTDGSTSSHMYPQRPSMNFCSPTTAQSTPPPEGKCKGAWTPSRRLRELRHDRQHGADDGHTPTTTQHSPQCAANLRERNQPYCVFQKHEINTVQSLSASSKIH